LFQTDGSVTQVRGFGRQDDAHARKTNASTNVSVLTHERSVLRMGFH
jgi:hypothetical protein